MIRLSELDSKILYELGSDARQSYKKIAQKIRSSKEVVAYHMAQLRSKGIITKFVPVISLTQLGIYSFKIYLKLHGLTEEAEKKVFDELVSSKDIIWVAKAVGEWDLLLGFYTQGPISFAKKKNEILAKFSQYIDGYSITMIEDALIFNRDYLINKKEPFRKEFVFGGEKKTVLKQDQRDLLKLINDDGRFRVVDIAKKLGEDPRTTIAKIKALEKAGVKKELLDEAQTLANENSPSRRFISQIYYS